jgi:hypothetical protein
MEVQGLSLSLQKPPEGGFFLTPVFSGLQGLQGYLASRKS